MARAGGASIDFWNEKQRRSEQNRQKKVICKLLVTIYDRVLFNIIFFRFVFDRAGMVCYPLRNVVILLRFVSNMVEMDPKSFIFWVPIFFEWSGPNCYGCEWYWVSAALATSVYFYSLLPFVEQPNEVRQCVVWWKVDTHILTGTRVQTELEWNTTLEIGIDESRGMQCSDNEKSIIN